MKLLRKGIDQAQHHEAPSADREPPRSSESEKRSDRDRSEPTRHLDDSYEIITANSRSGSFSSVVGTLINATTAWDVSYTPTSVLLTVVPATEEIIAGAIRSSFNDGVIQTRAHLDDWFDAGEIDGRGYAMDFCDGTLTTLRVENPQNARSAWWANPPHRQPLAAGRHQ